MNLKNTAYSFLLAASITVSPSMLRLDFAVDKPEAMISYTNHGPDPIELVMSKEDYLPLETNWGKDSFRYSLSSWISFDKQILALGPNESREVKITIDKSKLTAGGHYATILASVQNPGQTEKITVNPVISTLLFVRTTTGQEIEEGKVFDLQLKNNLATFRFQNSGNVDLTPYGTLQIFDSLGRKVSQTAINEDSLPTLPETIRQYTIPFKYFPTFLFPGKFEAKLTTKYGNAKQSFYSWGSVDPKIIIVLILGFLIILFRRHRKAKN